MSDPAFIVDLTPATLAEIPSFLEKCWGPRSPSRFPGRVLFWVWWTRRSNFRRKSFMRQVNFSLNEIQGDTLLLRTMLESEALEVWLSPVAVDLVLDAAQETTVEQPFMRMRNEDDTGFMNRAVLNVLSEKYSAAFIAMAVGVPVKTETFVFGVTCEKYGEIRTQKLRVMLIREELLKTMFAPGNEAAADALNIQHPAHKARITTLKLMSNLYHSDKPEERRMLDTIQLGVPVPASS